MPDTPVARTFDRTAEIYEQSRPGWPTSAVDLLAQELGLERSSTVLDIGAGTGKLTRVSFAGSPDEERREARFDNPQVLDREGMLAYFASMSWVAVLPDDERTDLLEEVRGLLDSNSYTRFWRSELHWTRFSPAEVPR